MILEPNWENCTEEELWKYVGYYFSKNSIDMVLVGGSVVSIYSKGRYRSGDLDFVSLSYMENKVPKLLNDLGFKKDGRVYSNKKCPHLCIDLVSPPLAIGNDYEIKPNEVNYKGKVLKILTPTDCIKDRLASYIYFEARECLDQALLVAQAQKFSKKEVKKWCKEEKMIEAYKEFIDILEQQSN
jgi:hypothetical protein